MRTIGIDLGKVNSQVSVRSETGEELRNVRVRTKVELVTYLEGQPQSRVLVEACTIARWAVNVLTRLGHEVVVADPNYLPMYVNHGSKRKKTDKRDASLLSLALHQNNWRAAHLRTEAQQCRKALVDARSRLVRSRTKHINGVRAQLLQYGGFMGRTEPERFDGKAQELLSLLPEELRFSVEVEVKTITALNQAIGRLDRKITKEAEKEPAARLLQSVPGVGPVTALSFVSVVDSPERFDNGHELASFLGLVPTESSSGEQRVLGHITKAGPAYMRALLTQVSHALCRSKEPEVEPLQAWAERIRLRRGKRIAIVALARKLAGILLAIWKSNRAFDPQWAKSSKRLAAA